MHFAKLQYLSGLLNYLILLYQKLLEIKYNIVSTKCKAPGATIGRRARREMVRKIVSCFIHFFLGISSIQHSSLLSY